jgi:hypothetical protein
MLTGNPVRAAQKAAREEGKMKRVDCFTKVMLAAIAAGLWALILRPVFWPVAVRAADEAPVATVVRAERFEVVDGTGRVCIRLASRHPLPTQHHWLARNLEPSITFLDSGGAQRAQLGITPSGNPALLLVHENGGVAAVLELSNEDSDRVYRRPYPRLEMCSEDGKARVLLTHSGGNSPTLSLEQSTPEDFAFASLGVASAGPNLSMAGRHGRAVVAATDGAASVTLRDKDDKVVWKAP